MKMAQSRKLPDLCAFIFTLSHFQISTLAYNENMKTAQSMKLPDLCAFIFTLSHFQISTLAH